MAMGKVYQRSWNLATSGIRILIVEDVQDSAYSMELLLKLWGYQSTVAYDGKHALEMAMTLRPDVVFLDIGLPDMDGCEVARRLRRMPELTETLLVAITGYGRVADIQRCKEAGIDLHFLKPVDPNQLRQLLMEAGTRQLACFLEAG
jgi:CheY-like chemotaxis protein